MDGSLPHGVVSAIEFFLSFAIDLGYIILRRAVGPFLRDWFFLILPVASRDRITISFICEILLGAPKIALYGVMWHNIG